MSNAHASLKAKQVLLDSLSRRQVSLLLLIDFSKAFDMVEHSILLKELEHYGIRGKASQWINSYLHNIMQVVQSMVQTRKLGICNMAFHKGVFWDL